MGFHFFNPQSAFSLVDGMLYKADPESSWTRPRPGPLEKADAGPLEKLNTKYTVWVKILFILFEDADFKYENTFLKFSHK